MRAAAVVILALVRVDARSLIFAHQKETRRTPATIATFRVYAIVGASSVFHLALVDVEASLGIRVQTKAIEAPTGEAALRVLADVRAAAVLCQTLVHVAARLASLVQTHPNRTATSDTSDYVETGV